MLAVSSLASADPPSRVVRLGHMTGAVSFSPAGEDDWVQATMNRPMTIGDRLWVDSGARAELQIGGAVLRLNAGTSVTVLNLDDDISQLQLTQGTMNVRVRRFDPNQMLEIDTPNLAFTVRQAGEYRIAVDTEGNATDVIVRKGQGEVYGEGASYVVDSRQPYRFIGNGPARVRAVRRAARRRFRSLGNGSRPPLRHIDLGPLCFAGRHRLSGPRCEWKLERRCDLRQRLVPDARRAAGWAPYRDGHWAWVDPWGWTWVDDAPWGFAVSHYGRWSNFGGRWGWVPGRSAHALTMRRHSSRSSAATTSSCRFRPATSAASRWFPLGPREVYRPCVLGEPRLFRERQRQQHGGQHHRHQQLLQQHQRDATSTYVNRQVPGAVVAVPTTAFVQSQPVARAAVRVTPQMVASAPVAQAAAVAPTERSVRGAAAQGGKPPARVFERPVVARTAPAPAQASFAAQQQQLQTRQGKPLDDAARKQIQAGARCASAERSEW